MIQKPTLNFSLPNSQLFWKGVKYGPRKCWYRHFLGPYAFGVT